MSAPGIPFYVHPAAAPLAWTELGVRFSWATGPDDGFVVLNVANGPGAADDPYYPAAIASLRAAAPELQLVGYVDVDYGERADAAVRVDIAAWASRYGITSVMLDRLPSGAIGAIGSVRRALAVVDLARSTGAAWVIGNPGAEPAPALAHALDVVCVREEAVGAVIRPVPRWLRAKAWVLVHGVGSGQEAVAARMCGGAAYAWVTSTGLPHPWDGSGWCPQPATR